MIISILRDYFTLHEGSNDTYGVICSSLPTPVAMVLYHLSPLRLTFSIQDCIILEEYVSNDLLYIACLDICHKNQQIMFSCISFFRRCLLFERHDQAFEFTQNN